MQRSSIPYTASPPSARRLIAFDLPLKSVYNDAVRMPAVKNSRFLFHKAVSASFVNKQSAMARLAFSDARPGVSDCDQLIRQVVFLKS